jgi:hypothetical protein
LPKASKIIGILLCTDKNDLLVKFSLPEDEKNIITSKYKLYLPSEEQLLKALNEELNNQK